MTRQEAALVIATIGWWDAPTPTGQVVQRLLTDDQALRDAYAAAVRKAGPDQLKRLDEARQVLNV